MAGMYGRLMMGHPGQRAPVAPPPAASNFADRARILQSLPPAVQRMVAAQASRPPLPPAAQGPPPGLVRPTLPNGVAPPPGMPPPGVQGPQGIPPQILQLLQQRQMQGGAPPQPLPPQGMPPPQAAPPVAPQQGPTPEMLQQYLSSMRAQGS
jgi:hypothetical protein